jgi:uroporphyrinogen-III synthase
MSRFVLITRNPADCTKLQEKLTPCGVILHPYPVLKLEDVVNDAGWKVVDEKVLPDSHSVWLVMASPRAPERFAAQCRHRDTTWLLDIPIAVIGDGTAAATTAAGLEPNLVGPGTGIGLAEELNKKLSAPTTVIYACGHHRRPELPDALETAGHTVVPLVVYRMLATPPSELPLIETDLDAVVVTSPRAAKLYLDGVGGSPLSCPHLALGPTTRDAARSMGIECLIPPEPSIDSLAEELCRI